MTTLSARLQELMRSHGVKSQSQLARRANVPQSTINRILKRDNYAPSLPTLNRLAKSLGGSVLWLAEGKGPVQTPAFRDVALDAFSSDAGVLQSITDSRLHEALSILERMDDGDRGKVLDVLRMIDRPRRRPAR